MKKRKPKWGGIRENQGRDRKGEEVRVRTSITLEPKLKEKGYAIAQERNQTFSDLINELLRQL